MAAGRDPANDAMAQTLNYALGNLGGGTRSWMHPVNPNTMHAFPELTPRPLPTVLPAAQAPRRRGRPPKNLAAVPSPSIPTVDSPVELQTERQSSSTSASPHLANILTGHDRRASVTVLPSPTPSEENNPLPNVSGAGATASRDFFSFNAAHANSANGQRSTEIDADPATRAVPNTKRLSTDMSAQGSKRPQLGQIGQARSATTLSAGPRGQYASNSRPQSTGPSRSVSNQAGPTHSPYSQQMRPQPSVPDSNPSLHAQGGHVDPRDALAHNELILSGIPVQTVRYPNQRTIRYTSAEYLQNLDAFKRSQGAIGALSRGDKIRLDALRRAVAAEDWRYVLIHQLYCLHDTHRSALSQSIQNDPALPKAMHMLLKGLDTNRQLSENVLQWFANYPSSVHTLQATWPRYGEFLAKFSSIVYCSSRFQAFEHNWHMRRCPPLASELVEILHLESPTLQEFLFTAILRPILQGVPPDHRRRYEDQAIILFRQNQADFDKRRRKGAEQGPDQSGQITYPNNSDEQYRASIKRVIYECASSLRSQPMLAPGPATLPQQQLGQQLGQQIHRQQQQQIQPQAVYFQHSTLTPRTQMAPRGQPPAQQYLNQPHHTGRLQIQPIPPSHRLPLQSRPNAPLLPRAGVQLPQQRQPAPSRFSLHQAHLRSPVPKARSLGSLLYQYMEGFVEKPTRLSTANRAIEKWSFNLSSDMVRAVAATVPRGPGQPGHRLVDKSSKTLRLRSIKWTASDRPEDHVWAITDTSWIPYSCFKLNGVLLEQRKKVHHGKDLPIDITSLVKEGQNVLDIMIMTDSSDESFRNYLVAIEFLSITCHDSVKGNCLGNQFKSTDAMVASLKSKLSSGSSEDDDLAIVESKLTINLFDPFSASKICDIPVRSRVCLHHDCFDLETFLSTRRHKGDVCDPDVWRCPICNADARPNYLITDGSLVDVKKVLDASGLSQTRAIVVHQDGTWQPKAEVRDPNGVSDDPPTPDGRRASVAADVIDLSD